MNNEYTEPALRITDLDGIDLTVLRYALDFCRSNLQSFTDKYDLDVCDEDMIYLQRMFDGAKSVSTDPYFRPTRKPKN